LETLSATRTELLGRRLRIRLARQGRDLLREKRDQLLSEFAKLADVVLAGADALERSAARARRSLARAEASDGPEAVRSAALAAGREIPLEAKTATVMGVRLPEIDHPPVARWRTARGYALPGASARIDAVAHDFEREVDLILEQATKELRLRRLAEEIGKATRRVNALELVVIPRLDDERRRIQAVLEEREREDTFRLKRVKSRREQRAREER
jgi:V/A-type H+-transporting ATPase subunit D